VLTPPTTWRDTPRACPQCLARIRQQEAELKAATLPPEQLEAHAQEQAQAVAQRIASAHPSLEHETSMSVAPKPVAPAVAHKPAAQEARPQASLPTIEDEGAAPLEAHTAPAPRAVVTQAAPAYAAQEEEVGQGEEHTEEDAGEGVDQTQEDLVLPLSVSFDMDNPFGPEEQDSLPDELEQKKQPARSGDGWLM
jgi:hypothetical protein